MSEQNKVFMHFDQLEDGKSIWLMPMPSGETVRIPAKVARHKNGERTAIIDSVMRQAIVEANQNGMEVEVLQFASCSTVFHTDGKSTAYEFGRPVGRAT